MITLNITSITDEIFALTALRAAVTSSLQIPPVLTRDNLPALRILVRSAFARIFARLLPYITDSTLGDGNPRAEHPYDEREPVELSIDFSPRTDHLSGGARMVLKRYLEHLTALTVLEDVYLPVDATQAMLHRDGAESLLSAVEGLLTIPDTGSPMLIKPSYY